MSRLQEGRSLTRRMPRNRMAVVVAKTVLGMAAAAATSAVLVGQFGRAHHTLDQFNSVLSLLLPVLALTLAAAIRFRDRPSSVVAVIGLIVGGYQLGGAALAGIGREPRLAGDALKVLSLSTYHANPDPDAIRRLIEAQAPDIAMLQETNGTAARAVDAALPDYYRIRSCAQPDCSLTILSRWPVQRIDIGWPGNQAHADVLLGVVDAPGGPVHVMDVHMPRPYEKVAQRLLSETATLAREHAAAPLIVAGDFNTATGTFGLDRFARISGLRRHDGFIPTYPANEIIPAFAGIDHVFASAHWARAGCRRTDAGHSDHYGVVCRIGLRRPI